MKIDKRKIITAREIDYIISFMLNTAQLEMRNHIYYEHETELGKSPPKYFLDTYKHMQLELDPKVYKAMFDAVSKYLKDNEELLIMYGYLDNEVVKFFEDDEA